MATNIGPKISVDGYAKYRSDMKNIIGDTQALKSEMGLLATKTGEAGSASDTYKKKVENLNDQIENQKRMVGENRDMLQKAIDKYGVGSDEVNGFRKALADSNRELADMEKQLDELGTPLGNFGKAMQDAGGKISEVGGNLIGAGKTLTTHVTTPILAIAGASATAASNFETVMSKVQALGGMSEEELSRLSDLALSLGSSTTWSAAEVGEGMSYMALAGWNTEQILAGIAPVLDLATASGEELSSTSDIVTDALTAFGLSAEDTEHFVDVLAQASRMTNTTVSLMGNAFKYAAPLAGTFGYSVEDIALALGLMANAGVKGEQAGTTLRSAITKLASPTEEGAQLLSQWGISMTDAEGNARPFSVVIGELRDAFQGLSADQATAAATALVGTEALSGFLTLMNTDKGYVTDLTSALNDCDGVAATMADTMQNTTSGAVETAMGAINTAAIKLGESFLPAIKDFAEKVGDVADAFAGLDKNTQDNIITAGLFLGAIGPVTTAVGGVVTAVGNITSAAGGLVSFLTVHPLAGVLAVGAIAAGWAILDGHILDAVTYSTDLTREAKEVRSAISKVNDQLEDSKDNLSDNISNAEGMAKRAGILADKIDELTKKEKLDNKEKKLLKAYVGELNEIYPDLNVQIDENGTSLNKSTGELREYIKQMKEMAKAEAYYGAMVDAYSAQAAAEVELAKAEKALKKAQDEANATAHDRMIIGAQLVDSAEDVATAQHELTKMFNDGKISEDEYAQAMDAVTRGEVALNGKTLTLAEAQGIYYDMSQKATSETVELRKAVDEANKAVDDAKEFADDMSEAYEGVALDVDTATKSTEGVTKAMADNLTGENNLNTLRLATKRVISAADLSPVKDKATSAGKSLVQGLANGLADPTNRNHVISQKDGLVNISTINNGKHLGLTAGKDLVQGVANGLADTTNRNHVISQKEGLVNISTINNGKHLGLMAGKDMVQGVANGMADTTKKGYVASQKKSLTESLKLSGTKSTGETAGKDFTQGVANGLNNETKLSYVRSGAANVKAAATPSGTYDAGYNTGTNIMSGLIQGVADKMDDWRTQMQNVADAGINKVNNLFRVGSPSRVMMETGHYIGEGLAIGVQREVPTVEHAMAQLFSPGMYGAHDFSVSASGSGGAAGNTVVNMTINGAPGQDVHELADIIEEQIAFNLRNREAAFA